MIPGTINAFPGAIGGLDRPFAIPGDFVDVTLAPGDGVAADGVAVTVVFAPTPTDPRHIVVLASGTPADLRHGCSTLAGRLQACAARPDVASITCLPAATIPSAGPVDLHAAFRKDAWHVRFRFPDTDEFLRACEGDGTPCTSDAACDTRSCSAAPNDNLTLAGPAVIAVTAMNAALPCEPEETVCNDRPGLRACVGTLFDVDEAPERVVHRTFPHFTALPPPNDFSALCETPDTPCNRDVDELRLAVDGAGNLLAPMDWRAVLVRRDEVPVARLLRGRMEIEAFAGRGVPLRITDLGALGSFSPEGSKLPPIFEPHLDASDPDAVTLFGSADAPAGVLRIARHDVPHSQCRGGSNDRLPCTNDDDDDCPGGACEAPMCLGGPNAGTLCGTDTECPGGECGAGLFEFRDRVLAGVGPVAIRRGDCPGGASAAACAGDAVASTGCGFQADALDPVPLEGLSQSETLDAFVVPEALARQRLNADDDTTDDVLKLLDRATGKRLMPGCPPADLDGRAVVRVRRPPFSFPAVALEDDLVAFLESEAGEGFSDRNANDRVFDAILRVFHRGPERMTDLLPDVDIPVDAEPLVDGRSLAISKGRVFFRSPEASGAAAQTAWLSAPMKSKASTGSSAEPALAGGGQFAAFSSASRTLVPRDSNQGSDIFATDGDGIVFGEAPVGNVRVSLSSKGRQSRVTYRDVVNGSRADINAQATISTGGRFVAFSSAAFTLVPRDRNHVRDIFLHDRDADGNGTFEERVVKDTQGVRRSGTATIRVSVDSDDNEANGPSTDPSLSTDGRFVAFSSVANDLVLGDGNGGGIDQPTACNPPNDPPANGELCRAVYDGADIFVHDSCRSEGVVARRCERTTERVSLSARDHEANHASFRPAISGAGRFVAFESYADNLVDGDTNGAPDVFVRDRCQVDGVGVPGCIPTTERVSVASPGGTLPDLQADGASVEAAISGDGRFVAFTSVATNLVAGDTNGFPDVFVHDRDTLMTVRVSVSSDGVEATGASNASAISSDGRFVAFASSASNLVPGDTNRCFVTAGTCLVANDHPQFGRPCLSASECGPAGECGVYGSCFGGSNPSGACLTASACPGGQCVTPSCTDVFVHDVLTGFTFRASVLSGDEQLDPQFYWAGNHPAISADGRYVAFDSWLGLSEVLVHGFDATDPAADVTGNGTVGETVLRVISMSETDAGKWVGACPAGKTAVANGRVAFLRPESAGPAPASCPLPQDDAEPFSLNEDADSDDEVVQLWTESGPAQNLGLAAHTLALSDAWIAAIGADVQVRAVAGGEWQSTGQTAETVQICGAVVAFVTDEAAQGAELNGDGDHADRVLQLYDPASATLVRVGQAAEEFVCSPTLLAFRTGEAAQGKDLNDDGDEKDFVLQTFDLGRSECRATHPSTGCVRNSARSVVPCRLEACDPRVPYRVDNATVTFLTLECDESGNDTNGCSQGGRDLNGDDDAGDLVLQTFTPYPPGALATASLAAAPSEAGHSSAAVTASLPAMSAILASVSAGICSVGGSACASDAECEAGTCFVPPGGCIADTGVECTPPGPALCERPPCPLGDDPCAASCTSTIGRCFCDPDTHTCKQVDGSCATNADCLAPASCNANGQRYQRLTGPLTAPRDGGKVFTSAGRCVEDLGPRLPCEGPAFWTGTTCLREHSTCRVNDDCPAFDSASNRVSCRQDLIIVGTDDGR